MTAEGEFDISSLIGNRRPESSVATERKNLYAAGGSTIQQRPGLEARLQPAIGYDVMAPEAPTYSMAFDVNRTNLPAQQAMTRYLQLPENVERQQGAIDASVKQFKDAGKSMDDLATESFKAAGAVRDTTSAEYAIAKMTQKRAETQGEYEAMSVGEAPSETLMRRYKLAQAKTTGPMRTDEERAEVQGAQADVASAESEIKAKYVARLQLEMDFQKQSIRGWQDYARQKKYAEEDTARAETRAKEAFAVQEQEARRGAVGRHRQLRGGPARPAPAGDARLPPPGHPRRAPVPGRPGSGDA
jgi:hypothetical protein